MARRYLAGSLLFRLSHSRFVHHLFDVGVTEVRVGKSQYLNYIFFGKGLNFSIFSKDETTIAAV